LREKDFLAPGLNCPSHSSGVGGEPFLAYPRRRESPQERKENHSRSDVSYARDTGSRLSQKMKKGGNLHFSGKKKKEKGGSV